MTNTPFSKKCEIIVNFTDAASQEPWAKGFFSYYDLGVAFAIGVNGNLITLNDGGTRYVNDTWDGLCKLLGVDSYGAYSDISDIMEFAGSIEEDSDE